jgi:5'-nucleotidase
LRVLVTNDDGIGSPGLIALAGVAHERGHDAIVVAPNWDSSGSSAAVTGVTVGGELVTEHHSWPGWADGAVLAVNATPALICRLAFEGGFGPPPDVVLSGINRGANTGRAILHSGTVGAAFTAYHERRPALAVSLAVNDGVDGQGTHWATSAMIAGVLFDWLTSERRHLVLNCNVPNVPRHQLRGIRVGPLTPGGVSQTSVSQLTGGTRPVTVGPAIDDTRALDDIRAFDDQLPVLDSLPVEGHITDVGRTDFELVAVGYASVTAVVPVVEDPSLDLALALGPEILGPRPFWSDVVEP